MTEKKLKNNKTKNLHVRIEPELSEEFERVTNLQSVNRSELVRRWIKEYLRGE